MLSKVASRHARSLLLLFTLACSIFSEAGEEPSRSSLARVICPAIDIENQARDGSLGGPERQPELVVLGTAKKCNAGDDDQSYDVTIDQVLYGSWPGKTLQFKSLHKNLAGRQIFALKGSIYEGDSSFDFRNQFPPTEEKAIAAGCAARLEYNALSAYGVFVGKELEANQANSHLVEVLRGLDGSTFREGQRLCINVGDYISSNKTRKLHSDPEIYFIAKTEHSGRDTSSPKHLICRLPVELEKQVQAALARRDEYPVFLTNDYGRREMVREVLFRGTTTQALDLLGSQSQSAVSLGRRFLIHKRKTTRAESIAALKKELFRHAKQKPSDFQGLRELIGVVGGMEREQATGVLDELIVLYIAHIDSHPTQPPAIRREEAWKSRYWNEERLTDFNHALTWLLMELDQKQVQKRYGSRLLELRGQTAGRWKDEVQLALDVCRVEDAIELQAALARMSNLNPVRSKKEMQLDYPYALAFSHDGKYLATANIDTVCVWNVKDWSLVASFPLEGTMYQVRFSPDDKLLYFAGGPQNLARYNWRTGKLDKAFKGHKSGVSEMELSNDEKVMATSNYFEKVFHVWDVPKGKIRKSFEMNELNSRLALSPDGKILIRSIGQDSWAVESLDGEPGTSSSLTMEGGLAFTPDGKYLATAEQRSNKDRNETAGDKIEPGKSPVTIKLRDVVQGFKEVASCEEVGLDSMPMISADGKRLVLHNAGPRGMPRRGAPSDRTEVNLAAFSLPKLERVSKFKLVTPKRLDMESMALSPDGKILAVAAAYRNPYLFDTDTGKPVLPVAAHSDRITSLHFLRGAKTVRTIGQDGTVCLWDAVTMKLLRRILLPAECEIKAVREPDGKYVVCFFPGSKETHLAKVFDTDMGKPVSEITLPRRELWMGDIQWLNERELLHVIDESCCVFDCMTGKVLRRFEAEHVEHGCPSHDGKRIFTIGGGFNSAGGSFGCIDTTTGQKVVLGEFPFDYGTGNWRGLVPGGKYFYLGNPGMYFLDRRTFKEVGAQLFQGMNLISHSFCDDGSRYALAVRDELFVGGELVHDDRHVKSVVRLIETLTGKTQFAFVPSTNWVEVKLSPNGRRVAVINRDNTLELWDLPTMK